jgi:transposase
VALLNGRYRLSKRETQALMGEVFGVEMSVGSVVALSEQMGSALQPAYGEVQAIVAQSRYANLDETSWKERGARRWLWVAVTTVATLFYLAASRAGREVAHLVGQAYAGVVGSDRYAAYRQFAVEQRQLCWAHLKRDLVACSDRSGAVGAWGKRALEVVAQLFALWHRFKQGEIDRATLQAQMHPLQTDFHALLVEGQTLPSWSKAQPFCNDLLSLEPALWTFLFVEGVEPTNNAAERALRPAVLWRKGCFGSRSQAGLRFTEAILTVTATCRQQQRPLLPFLSDSLAAHWAGQQAPSLFPTP